jgi:type IX secretion system PorP/SprF family membrane protein
MLKREHLIIFTCILTLGLKTMAQDVSYSQFFANRLYQNPAWAGIGNEKRAFLNYRNQYPGLGGIYNTYTASYDQYADKLKGGIGVSLCNDMQGAGAINQMTLSGMYSYQVKTGRFLSFSGGLEASGVYRSINAKDFLLYDQYDGNDAGDEKLNNISKIFPDFSAGVAAFYKEAYGGISMFHLLKPYQSESSLPESRLSRKITVFAGTYLRIYEKRLGREVLQLNPNLIYIQQKDLSQLIYGLEGLYKNKYVAGLWIRQNLGLKYSALIFSGGISMNNIRLRYSYDAQFSKPTVRIQRMGANEISVIFAFGEIKKIKHKAIKCPKI